MSPRGLCREMPMVKDNEVVLTVPKADKVKLEVEIRP